MFLQLALNQILDDFPFRIAEPVLVAENVRKAAESFDRELLAPGQVDITSDSKHLADLIERCDMISGKRFLDLGTRR